MTASRKQLLSRCILRIGLMLLLLLAVGRAAAEPAFSFAATPGKLPKTVAPIRYALDLIPDLDKLSLSGSEVVDIEVMAPAERLVLNAVDMTIDAAAVDSEAASAIAPDADAQTVTFAFPHPIAAGRHQLRISFTGRINRFGRGLFAVDYPAADGRKRMISSHLEPADARRIFPSWDEPAFKASIALTVTVPQAFLAVANMPIAREEPAGDDRKRVAFQPTPRMSSYLFVLAAGELERASADVDGVTVGVVAARGKGQQGRYALGSAVDLLRYYNDYFGVAYPLPKLDLIAVPGGFGGAMENWAASPSSRAACCSIPPPARATRGAASSTSSPMKWRINGSATSSPWPGGTTSGSTKASQAGCRRRPRRLSIRIGDRKSTRLNS